MSWTIVGWALVAAYLGYCVWQVRRFAGKATDEISRAAYEAGVKAGRAEVAAALSPHKTCAFCKGELPEWECELLHPSRGEEQT